MAREKVIYVCGGEGTIPGKMIFRSAAFRYAHPRKFSNGIDLIIFDYHNDRIELFPDWKGWDGKVPPPKGPFQRLRRSPHPVELYNKIASLGGSDPGCLIGLHFFTHGTFENGFSFGPVGPSSENAFFQQFHGVDLWAFKAAFSRNALIKLWGCGGHAGSVSDQFNIKNLTLSYCAIRNKKTQDKRQAQIEAHIRNMYARRLAYLLDLTVWATPPGWSSEIDLPHNRPYIDEWNPQTGPNKNSCWWRVDRFLDGDGAYFYRDILGASIDPTGYVGITEQMSQAPPPSPEKIRCPKSANKVPDLLKDFPR